MSDDPYHGRPGTIGHSVMRSFSELRNSFLDKESDRAVAVLGPAHLDSALKRLLKLAFLPGESATKLLGGDDGDGGPIGSFSARIDLSHAMALIQDVVRDDLHVIRTIRNKFAHRVEANDFSLHAAMDLCRNLKLMHAYFGETKPGLAQTRRVKDAKSARDMFIMTTNLLSTHIASAIQRVEHRGPLPPALGPKDPLVFASWTSPSS